LLSRTKIDSFINECNGV